MTHGCYWLLPKAVMVDCVELVLYLLGMHIFTVTSPLLGPILLSGCIYCHFTCLGTYFAVRVYGVG